MSLTDKLPRGVRRLFSLPSSQERMLAEFDEEVHVHLAMRVAELEAQGFTRQAAEAEARRRFGDADSLRREIVVTARRQARAAGLTEWFRSTGQDIRFASRRLLGSPLFVLATTATLAIAIGATASLFGIVNQVLVKPYPYRDPDRVLDVQASQAGHVVGTAMSPADFLDYRAQNTVFSSLAAYHVAPVTVQGSQESERVWALVVTPNYATTVGLTPVLGRFLAADSAGPAEVVIGYAFWQRRFGGERSVLGQVLRLDSLPYTIVGVMPPGLPTSVVYDSDLWMRLGFVGTDQIRRNHRYLSAFGRLKANVPFERAQQDLNRIAGQLAVAYPADKVWTVTATPLLQSVLGTITPTLTALLGAAVCVLLVGAANLANLFLVRYLGREREIALRTAIGATRARIIRELAIESVLLGLIAAAFGIVLSVVGIRALRALAPATLPRVSQATVDGGVVAFGVLATLVTVLLFGVLPAWRASHGDLADVVKESGRTAGTPRRHRLQSALVMLQMAIALILVTGAGLFLESFERFQHMDPGFQPDGLLTLRITPPSERYSTPEKQAAFVADILEHLSAVPGVRVASMSNTVPTAGANVFAFDIVGDPAPDPGHVPNADLEGVTSDYYRTMGIPLRRGRGVLPTDDRRAPEIMVVDELFAHMYFPGRNPVGQRLDFGRDTLRIVGVVGSVRQRGLAADETPVMYTPLAQYPTPDIFVEARSTGGDPAALAPLVKQAILAVDASVPTYDIKTMDTRMAESTGATRFSTLLASLFAAVALALSVVGLYSVLAYVVRQRQRELGVRLALGASNRHVMSEVLRQAAALTVGGVAVGTLAAWLLARALAGIFIGVSPHDPVVFAAAVVGFAAVALVATSVPAWRTTRINPAVVLTST